MLYIKSRGLIHFTVESLYPLPTSVMVLKIFLKYLLDFHHHHHLKNKKKKNKKPGTNLYDCL